MNYQKLQPKFKDCTFDSDKKPEYLRTWLRLLSGIVRNIPHGKQIENFLDSYLQRRLNEATTRPSFLQEAGLQLSAPTAEAPSSAEGTNDQGSEAEVSINDPSEYPKAYYQLSSESQALDKALFHTLFTIVQGSYLDLITDLTGENGVNSQISHSRRLAPRSPLHPGRRFHSWLLSVFAEPGRELTNKLPHTTV